MKGTRARRVPRDLPGKMVQRELRVHQENPD